MKTPTKIALGITAIVCVWIASGIFSSKTSHEKIDAKAAGVDLSGIIKTQILTAAPHVRYITLNGSTEPNRKVALKPETEGRIISIPAKEGSRLKKNDIILQLDVRDRKERLEEAKAVLRQRELEYEAAKKLTKTGFRTEISLAEAKARLESARADLTRIRLDLEHTTIRAPFDGVLERINAELGDFVAVGFFGGEAALATFFEHDPLKVTGQVSERDLENVKLGSTAKVELATGREVQGLVKYIGSLADGGSRTYTVEVAIANADNAIPSGMSAQIKLPTGEVGAYKVASSVLSLDDKGTVGVKLVGKDNVVTFKPVKIIEETPDGLWIADLPDSIALITVGGAFVNNGQAIALPKPAAK